MIGSEVFRGRRDSRMALTETFDPSEGSSQNFGRDWMIGSENLKSPKRSNYIQEVRQKVHKRDLLNAEIAENLKRV